MGRLVRARLLVVVPVAVPLVAAAGQNRNSDGRSESRSSPPRDRAIGAGRALNFEFQRR